jgi:hypothetical protein
LHRRTTNIQEVGMRKIEIEDAKYDLEDYGKALACGDTGRCLCIEREHGLDGYPPNIVIAGLRAKSEGKNMGKELDKMMGM